MGNGLFLLTLYFLVIVLISSSIGGLFGNILFTFQGFISFSIFFLKLIYNLITLQPEDVLCSIPVLLNRLCMVFFHREWFVLVNA